MMAKIGVLLTNIGSPAAPTVPAVRSYLRKFLSDPRVVELPRMIWWPILHGFILRLRPRQSARLYQKIWTSEGSPLVFFSQQLAAKLQATLNLPVAIGMHYSQPTIASALQELRQQGVNKLIVLPLYPHYSATTTAATFDQIATEFKTWRNIPAIRFVYDYADNEDYIAAIAKTIQQQAPRYLLFSFHGIPKRYADLGDPYPTRCQLTAERVAQKLNLSPAQWRVAFQSRLGKAQWLQPYTDQVLTQLPKQGIDNIHLVCPGFSVDCLETLEEIALRGQEQFLTAGGKELHYIPALNDSSEHVHVLEKIILQHLQNW